MNYSIIEKVSQFYLFIIKFSIYKNRFPQNRLNFHIKVRLNNYIINKSTYIFLINLFYIIIYNTY